MRASRAPCGVSARSSVRAPMRCRRVTASAKAAAGGGSRSGRAASSFAPPLRHRQRHAGKVAVGDLRPIEEGQSPLLGRVPQAVADARLRAPCPAPPLIRRRPADLHRHQPGETRARIVAGRSRQPGIDHHPHALDGETGLRDAGGEHHLAPARRRRGDSRILLPSGKGAVERANIDRGRSHRLGQPFGGAPDLGLTGQEHQHIARLVGEGFANQPGHVVVQALEGVSRAMPGLDGVRPALAFDHGRVAHQPGDRRPVQRRRHHQKPQVGPQQRLRLQREGQPQIGIQRALVELVEDHARHRPPARDQPESSG